MNMPTLLTNRNRQNGFTIVELIAVIAIIGALLVLIIITHAGVERSERDTERQRDVKALHTELEAYYALNNRYPLLSDVNNSNWRSTNMKGLDSDVLQDPNNVDALLIEKPDSSVYAYKVTSAKGTKCDNQKTLCTQYTLTATLENGQTFTKNNLN
jgi:prepilin-type N-terminal cleavage/methylation domain-containing protein